MNTYNTEAPKQRNEDLVSQAVSGEQWESQFKQLKQRTTTMTYPAPATQKTKTL